MDTEQVSRSLGVAVRDRRKALGLTQAELAGLAGCGPLFVIELERGKPTIRVDKLIAVLVVLGLQLRVENGVGGIVARH
ncbi:MAG: type II toxin-antitoxin system Y4mF family antitoxin [Fimbriimonadaceae bacterium]